MRVRSLTPKELFAICHFSFANWKAVAWVAIGFEIRNDK
jgi:hypothetical protein